MQFAWWAIRNISIDDMIVRALEPEGFIRDPRWMSAHDLDEIPCACFSVGEWTFALLRDGENELDARFASLGTDVIKYVCVAIGASSIEAVPWAVLAALPRTSL